MMGHPGTRYEDSVGILDSRTLVGLISLFMTVMMNDEHALLTGAEQQ